jgi:hypothetical protein
MGFQPSRMRRALEEASPTLRRFSCLKYLTFMAGGAGSTSDDEESIAKCWAQACPSLRTIILPEGKVWFQKHDTWA